jgi:hypothetical protein
MVAFTDNNRNMSEKDDDDLAVGLRLLEKRDTHRDPPNKNGECLNRQPPVFIGVPTGIRTPVAGVKGAVHIFDVQKANNIK